jgi:hypothetical protein
LFDLEGLRRKWGKSEEEIMRVIRGVLVSRFLARAQQDAAHRRRVQNVVAERDLKKARASKPRATSSIEPPTKRSRKPST